MPQIEIDFEVFKHLTNRRETEAMTYNDVIRDLLKLPDAEKARKRQLATERPWIVSDTSFPAGTEFIADYKGSTYTGVVKNGKLELSDGRRFETPSAAAMHITRSSVNGWRFWKCKVPGSSMFVPIERLRGKSH